MKKLLLTVVIAIFATGCSAAIEQEAIISDYEIDLQIPEPNYPDKAIFESFMEEPFEFVFDTSQDMQLPEMPHGCEAVALTTLLRLNDVGVTKFEVADAMPKGSDFVNQYWGDPYLISGWACMAPCSAYTASIFTEGVEDITGTEFKDLPLPSTIWTTIDLAEPIPSVYSKDGYTLMHNPHCITIVARGPGIVKAIDPLMGWVELEGGHLEYIYNQMGKQAVTIKE